MTTQGKTPTSHICPGAPPQAGRLYCRAVLNHQVSIRLILVSQVLQCSIKIFSVPYSPYPPHRHFTHQVAWVFNSKGLKLTQQVALPPARTACW